MPTRRKPPGPETAKKPAKKPRSAQRPGQLSTSARRARFVSEYLKDRNATQAAIRAGYSPKTATAQGSRLLTCADVRAMVDRHAAPIFDQYEINNDRILRELALMGFANIADYGRIGDDGEFRVDLSETSRDQFAAVSSVKSKRSVRTIGDVEIDEITTEIKLSEKRAALMDLARIRGLTKDDGGAGANVTFNVFWNPGGPLPQPYDDEEDAA